MARSYAASTFSLAAVSVPAALAKSSFASANAYAASDDGGAGGAGWRSRDKRRNMDMEPPCAI
jgi:hypothetical protein